MLSKKSSLSHKNNLSWKIGGEAGFGIKSAGIMLGKIFMRSGYEIFDYTEYPSLIRGGHNTYQLLVDTRPTNSVTRQIDVLVALNQETVVKHKDELVNGGAIIYDQDNFKLNPNLAQENKFILLGLPLTILAKAAGGELMRNVVALGASLALVGQNLTVANKVVRELFSKKGEKVVANNIQALRSGFDWVKKNFKGEFICQLPSLPRQDNILISANESLALGALTAGLNFFVAYPMTPSTSILHYLAGIAPAVGMVVKHAEDEIAVINMALGAAHVGARAMVATSGGGFALMTESLGLASITETPLVIVEVQRPGPATGLPTWTEQGDLQFMLHAAQGDFPRIIMAPGDASEAYTMGAQALNLAEIYQLPVIILSDKLIAEGNSTVKRFAAGKIKINRGKLLSTAQLKAIKNYRRYRLVNDGISPRALPGMPGGLYIANSDEHDNYGFSEETADNRQQQVDKRQNKLATFYKTMPEPLVYGEPRAKKTVVVWGSTKGVVLDAYSQLETRTKKKIKIIQYQYLWPLAKEFTRKMLSDPHNVLIIENNSNGQLVNLLAQETGIVIKNRLLKYDGRPFFREEIINALKNF